MLTAKEMATITKEGQKQREQSLVEVAERTFRQMYRNKTDKAILEAAADGCSDVLVEFPKDKFVVEQFIKYYTNLGYSVVQDMSSLVEKPYGRIYWNSNTN